MPKLNLKPNHKAIRDYYATLQQYEQQGIRHEGAVSSPFEGLLHACAKQVNATLVPQYAMRAVKGNRIVIDGVVLDEYGLPFVYWEAKDIDDTLAKAVQEKRDAGYPLDNILFQTPQRVILYQNGQVALDLDITEPAGLIAALQYLFSYVPPALDNWHTAVSDFRAYVPDLANKLKELIDDTISKWDIFHYNYALLHHPTYREKYEMNLKRDLPHIPFAEDFLGFAAAGDQLADLHVNYESVPKYDGLKHIETPGLTVDWRVEKMRLSKDKTQLKYNEFLTLDSIPAEVYDYRLGNRSALEWVVDQYRVKTDKRSGIVNDPNRADQPQYIVDLIGRVITVSLKTVKIVKNLPAL